MESRNPRARDDAKPAAATPAAARSATHRRHSTRSARHDARDTAHATQRASLVETLRVAFDLIACAVVRRQAVAADVLLKSC